MGLVVLGTNERTNGSHIISPYEKCCQHTHNTRSKRGSCIVRLNWITGHSHFSHIIHTQNFQFFVYAHSLNWRNQAARFFSTVFIQYNRESICFAGWIQFRDFSSLWIFIERAYRRFIPRNFSSLTYPSRPYGDCLEYYMLFTIFLLLASFFGLWCVVWIKFILFVFNLRVGTAGLSQFTIYTTVCFVCRRFQYYNIFTNWFGELFCVIKSDWICLDRRECYSQKIELTKVLFDWIKKKGFSPEDRFEKMINDG